MSNVNDLRKRLVPRWDTLRRNGFSACPTCPTLSHGAIKPAVTWENASCPTHDREMLVPRQNSRDTKRCDQHKHNLPCVVIFLVPRCPMMVGQPASSTNTPCPTRSKSGTRWGATVPAFPLRGGTCAGTRHAHAPHRGAKCAIDKASPIGIGPQLPAANSN